MFSNIKAVMFDLGHTIMDEVRDGAIPCAVRPVHLMPGVAETLPRVALPKGIWANTTSSTADLWTWLRRAGIARHFQWLITSRDAGARKPSPQFFAFALAQCGLSAEDVLFVGNQLNADVAGAQAVGIKTVWLCGAAYHSADDDAQPGSVQPSYSIDSLLELPGLLQRL